MPYQLIPLVERKLMLCVGFGNVSAEDVSLWEAEVQTQLEDVDGLFLSAIYDMSRVTALPPLSRVVQVQVGRHEKAGWVVFSGVQNKPLMFILSVIAQMSRARTRFVANNAEALALIHDVFPDMQHLTVADIERAVAFAESRYLESQSPAQSG
jgi:hypothetical protein